MSRVAFATKESMILRAEIVFRNLLAWLEGGQENIMLVKTSSLTNNQAARFCLQLNRTCRSKKRHV